MGYRPDRNQAYDFLQDDSNRHDVLAYLNMNGHPDTAYVAFSATPQLGIIFGTSDQSYKYRLLHTDHRVAFNVTDWVKRWTVQLKGRVDELSKADLKPFETDHYAKLGTASKRFRDLPDQHFFHIEPHWLRFSDCLEEPWTLTTLIGERR